MTMALRPVCSRMMRRMWLELRHKSAFSICLNIMNHTTMLIVEVII